MYKKEECTAFILLICWKYNFFISIFSFIYHVSNKFFGKVEKISLHENLVSSTREITSLNYEVDSTASESCSKNSQIIHESIE